ncbi:amino acid adenylation domain-containing protein [Nocardia sp. NPDC060256]|uniref:amino acid adenylation domain-containing protein n=1 Tax=unclassified Nocardia TaxID=2637762 RepID=UPI0036658AE2
MADSHFRYMYPRGRTVHELFEAWVDRAPDAPAVRYGEVALSYRELDIRANRLGHYLRRSGIGAEARVGLCVRDENWVIGALATLKAGGVYVPLDPSYPPERLDHMCRDAGVQVVLRAHGETVKLPGRQVFLDTLEIDCEPSGRLGVSVGPQSLAYIMYTSGSTGTPKGVAVGHRNIVRLVRSRDSITVRHNDTAVQAANISFDAATLETWGALLNGARLVGLGLDEVLVPERLGQALRAHGVDVLFLPTALLRQLALEDPSTFRTVRQLSFGGEKADVRAVTALLRHCPDTELVNLYGPTEITTYATAYRCNGLSGDESSVPIGRAAANSSAYVLDDTLRPVRAERPGELYLGGDGVARGYLGRPGATAQRFVADPFTTEPGARMYRTGDLVRRRADGELEFLGRVDRQVKVRGHRVEPAEVEDALGEFPGLSEVVVLAGRDAGGDTQLIAYVVLRAGVSVDSLRAYLAGRIPHHLIPAVFVTMARLPLNPNGKVDTAALPAPVAIAPGDPPEMAATPTEQVVQAIWQDVLGVAVTRTDADFFELGGHSLAAARVRSRLSAVFGAHVPLRIVFEHTTIGALARAVEGLPQALPAAAPAPQAARLSVADLLAEFEI